MSSATDRKQPGLLDPRQVLFGAQVKPRHPSQREIDEEAWKIQAIKRLNENLPPVAFEATITDDTDDELIRPGFQVERDERGRLISATIPAAAIFGKLGGSNR
jgi:hypothetical protein